MEAVALIVATISLCLAIVLLFINLYRLGEEGFYLQTKLARASMVLLGMFLFSYTGYVFLAY